MCSSRLMHSGSATLPRIAAPNSASFDGKCRSTAAGVTWSSAAISASVAPAKPFSVNTARAACRICSWLMVGGRPICK